MWIVPVVKRYHWFWMVFVDFPDFLKFPEAAAPLNWCFSFLAHFFHDFLKFVEVTAPLNLQQLKTKTHNKIRENCNVCNSSAGTDRNPSFRLFFYTIPFGFWFSGHHLSFVRERFASRNHIYQTRNCDFQLISRSDRFASGICLERYFLVFHDFSWKSDWMDPTKIAVPKIGLESF